MWNTSLITDNADAADAGYVQLGANNGAVFHLLRRSLSAGCSRVQQEVEPRKFHVGASTHIPGLFATQSSPYTYACTGTCILGIVIRRHSPWLDVRASPLIRDFESESIACPSARYIGKQIHQGH